jgi:GntR family transcriptional regulator, transcriptional repressor for pyruvate dehydrogenase complex
MVPASWPLDRERPRLSDMVKRHFLRRLAEGELRPGDSLPSEADLARRFNVSKTVVREGLRELVAMGVISIQQGKATTVRPLSAEPLQGFFQVAVRSAENGLRQAVELRRAIETDIAELAAIRASDAEIAELGAVMAQMRRASGDIERWLEVDIEFHRRLVRMAKNTLMDFLLEALGPTIRETVARVSQQAQEIDVDGAFERHNRIYLAIRRRQPARARRAMEAHFAAAIPLIEGLEADFIE